MRRTMQKERKSKGYSHSEKRRKLKSRKKITTTPATEEKNGKKGSELTRKSALK